ncbi:MAG: hypothetical protein ACLFPL_05715 [Candidatus Nanoarchaeia archaeon]
MKNLQFTQYHIHSQISIFIVIVSILLVGIVILMSSSSQKSSDSLNRNFQDSSLKDFNIYNIMEASNQCLQLSTQKALLLLSIRGGMIYPHPNSVQFSSDLNSFKLNDDRIVNLDLNRAELQRYIFPSLTQEDYINKLSFENLTNQMQHYIVRDFIHCQFKSFNEEDFNNFTYSIVDTQSVETQGAGRFTYDTQALKTQPDSDSVDVLLYTSQGEIIDSIYNSSLEKIVTQEYFQPEDRVVAVVKGQFDIDVSILNNEIQSRIQTTDSFDVDSTDIDRSSLTTQIKSSLSPLFSEAQKLAREKKINRSIDFTNSQHLSNIDLNSQIYVRVRNVSVSEDEILQVITLTDTSNVQYNNDMFVFSYHNTAPELGKESFVISNAVDVNLATNPSFLFDKINHSEYEDELIRQYQFVPQSDSFINLHSNGSLELLTDKGFFSREFYVTDGELDTQFTINFNLGGALNNNNAGVSSCFEITYDLDSGLDRRYDVHNTVVNNSTRRVKLNNKVDRSGNYEWYGFVTRGSSPVQVDITPNSNCFDPTDTFNYLQGSSSFILTSSTPTQQVSIQPQDSSGNILGDAFNFTIGSVTCLGPRDIGTLNGTGTCCDISGFKNDWNNKNFSNIISNSDTILPSGTLAYESDYMRVCPQNSALNPTSDSDWQLNSSNFKAREITTSMQVYCQGTSPLLEENQISTVGTNSVSISSPSSISILNYNATSVYSTCQQCEFNSDTQEAFQLEGTINGVNTAISVGSIDTQNVADADYGSITCTGGVVN